MRRQLECVAKAGGGTYVDVPDAAKLGDELAAALARAFRGYEPDGDRGHRRVRRSAAYGARQAGLFQDTLAPGDERWYAVDVPEGRRLLATVSAIPSHEDRGNSTLQTELFDPRRTRLDGDGDVLSGAAAGVGGRVRSHALTMRDFAGAAGLEPGRYVFRVAIEEGLETAAVPVELAVQLLQPGETPGLTRAAGQVGPAQTPAPTAEPERTPARAPRSDDAIRLTRGGRRSGVSAGWRSG